MKTINVLVGGVLLLGSAYIAKDYLTTECVVTTVYVRDMPKGKRTYQELETGRCYLLKK